MVENTEPVRNEELKKLTGIATDMQLDSKLRIQSIDLIGNIGSHKALLALLSLAGNTQVGINERDLALKRAREIVKANR